MTPLISIIIPTLNEEQVIARTLARLLPYKGCEIIVVDGGSSDATLGMAEKSGCTTLSSPSGRGVQMNLGAACATAEILLFLHADTQLPDNFPELVLAAVARPGFAAGAFSLAIDSTAQNLTFIARMANLRSRLLHLPYGDQALFTTRQMFAAVGGFAEIAIMEDFVFIEQVKKRGTISILPECATTSARRWRNVGIVRTTIINQLIVIGYKIGIPPATLAGFYQRVRGIRDRGTAS